MTSTRASRLKSLSEIQTRYSGDDTVVEDYTEEFGSDTESIATISKTSQTSEKTITDSYRTESETETYTQSDKSPRTDSRVIRSKKTRTAEVQTSEPGLHYTWDSRYSGYAVPGPSTAFTDPTPIATHVVSADALEAMTAYSPSMLALQDLLRQQLQLTREFLHTQRYLYKSLADNIDTSYKYSTLEETKQV
ncbi:hypothetical protein FSP39_019424 [Pinctada imbricata]|uniref:DUF4614 domain-containing protein n=1 Tax=Pinctada imbricata TaxID=66713 RepID=A0AA89BXN6_PINIB|nr:hypothetical protein FSP39_019424 [Pinctada imbricata]